MNNSSGNVTNNVSTTDEATYGNNSAGYDPNVIRGGIVVYSTNSIQDAINNAQNGDIIRLENGATFHEHELTLPAGITNLTFDVWNAAHTGPGGYATINGDNSYRIIYINNGVTVNFYNITFTKARSTYYQSNNDGGAIYNTGTSNIYNCNFQLNDANNGGAIYNTGTLNIYNSKFDHNIALSNGGAIYNTGTLNINGSTFTDNTANYVYNGDGGAIYNTGTLKVYESTFTGNTADTGKGGAIWNSGGDATSRIIKFNQIIGNTGNSEIYSETGTMDATLNWWGSNDSPASNVYGSVNYSPWLFMTINSTPSTINNTQNSLITVSFNNHSSDGITYTPLDPNQGHIPDGTRVDFSLTNGPFGSLLPLTAYTSNGTASTLFTASSCGVQTVNATNDNQKVTTTITVNPSAHIELDIFYADYNEFVTHNNIVKITDPVNYLDKIIVVFTATNMGPNTITFLQLREDWPDELVGTNQAWWGWDGTNWLSNAWSPPGGSFSWWPTNVGSVKPGDTFWGVIGATVNQSNTILTNNITTINQLPVDTQDFDTKSANLQVNPAANITVIKTGPTEAIAGTTIIYTITVTNNGPDPAENVQIVDNISSILQGVTHDHYNLGTIPSGESRTITINGTIPSNTTNGTIIQNNATATTNTPGTITPSLMVITTVETQADLNLTQNVDNNRPEVGDTVTYTVTIHNNGPSDATNIQIQDIMPSDFTDVNVIPSKGTYDPGTKIWTLNLTSGETTTLNLTGKVTAIMAGKNTTNTATLVGTTNQTNATIYVPKADLYVQITSDKNNPTVGETFTLRYKLGNKGPDDATNVTITIPLPEGFVISKIEGDGNWTVTGNTITWTMNNVTVGDPDLYITVKALGTGSYTITPTITSETFNRNTDPLMPFSISVHAQNNSDSNTVNAASTSKTVPMQTTGMPIAGLILAILAVLGGVFTPRKK
jgi:uncharacterized repeat protein (TIGR01451 family)